MTWVTIRVYLLFWIMDKLIKGRMTIWGRYYTLRRNDCIRKIFGLHRLESTRELRKSLGYESITEIFAKRNSRFLNGISRTGISVLIQLKSLSYCSLSEISLNLHRISHFTFFSLNLLRVCMLCHNPFVDEYNSYILCSNSFIRSPNLYNVVIAHVRSQKLVNKWPRVALSSQTGGQQQTPRPKQDVSHPR